MKRIVGSILLFLFLVSCSEKSNVEFSELSDSLVNAEKVMRTNELVVTTASSSQLNEVKFRIIVEDRITNEEAKELIYKFIETIEEKLSNPIKFKDTYNLFFDITSKDGVIYNGKREMGQYELWWQF
jgi:hypothetical protein